MGEPDGGRWGQRIPVAKAFPAPGHGRDAVLAIRLRTASSRLIITKHPASSIGSSDAIRERVEALRGERLRSVLPHAQSIVKLEIDENAGELAGQITRVAGIHGRIAREVRDREATRIT